MSYTKIYKSISKTAKNNSFIKKNKVLFDFSIFADSEIDKNIIKDIQNNSIEICENCNVNFNDYQKIINNNNFVICDITFKIYIVEDDFKILYKIFEAVDYTYSSIIIKYDGTKEIEKTEHKRIKNNYKKEYIKVMEN